MLSLLLLLTLQPVAGSATPQESAEQLRVRFRVTDEKHTPIPDAVVRFSKDLAWGPLDHEPAGPHKTASDGSVALDVPLVEPNILGNRGYIVVELLGYSIATTPIRGSIGVAERVLDLGTIALKRGVDVTIHVRDTAGAAISGAQIAVFECSDRFPRLASPRDHVTSSEGLVSLSGLRGSRFEIEVSHSDYVTSSAISGGLRPGGYEHLAIVLEGALQLSGTLLYADGKPVPHGAVELTAEGWQERDSCDREGRFVIRGVPVAKQYQLEVTNGALATTFRAANLDEFPDRFVRERGATLVISFSDESGPVTAAVDFPRVKTDTGIRNRGSHRLLRSGRYLISDLWPIRSMVEVRPFKHLKPDPQAVELQMEETSEISFQLVSEIAPVTAEFTLTVLDDLGVPIAGVMVRTFGPERLSDTTTDALGQAVALSQQSDDFRLHASKDGYDYYNVTQPQITDGKITLVLARGAAVSVTVVGDNQKPSLAPRVLKLVPTTGVGNRYYAGCQNGLAAVFSGVPPGQYRVHSNRPDVRGSDWIDLDMTVEIDELRDYEFRVTALDD